MRNLQRPGMPAPQPTDAPRESLYREVADEAGDLYTRGVAALAHVLVLLSLPGLAVVWVIWVAHRRRSPFIEQHARQAMRRQIQVNVTSAIIAVVLLILLFGGFGVGVGRPSTGDTIAGSLSILALLGLLLLFVSWLVIALVSAVIGAGSALLGREPHRPRQSQ
jgi:uncharacterized Tic20 family protein